MCPWPPARKRRAPCRPTNAASSAAASWRSTRPPGSRCGRPTPSPRRRSRPRRTPSGRSLYGPSARRCGRRRLDPVKRALYITTGNNYSDPGSPMSDAFVAMDLETGRILWHKQMTANDAYTAACRLPDKTNCADSNGPDWDFGASPMLVTLAGGRRLLLAGQKSGIVHALDPDKDGERRVADARRPGRHHGRRAVGHRHRRHQHLRGQLRHRPDHADLQQRHRRGSEAGRRHVRAAAHRWRAGLVSAAGELRHQAAVQPGAVGGAVTAIPGVAFSGSVDGHMRAYSTSDGTILWDVNTIDVYEGVNGVLGRGGSNRRPRPHRGQRHRLRELGLPHRRRHAGQRAARVFCGREVAQWSGGSGRENPPRTVATRQKALVAAGLQTRPRVLPTRPTRPPDLPAPVSRCHPLRKRRSCHVHDQRQRRVVADRCHYDRSRPARRARQSRGRRGRR